MHQRLNPHTARKRHNKENSINCQNTERTPQTQQFKQDEELGVSNRGQAWDTREGSGGQKSRWARHRLKQQEVSGVKVERRTVFQGGGGGRLVTNPPP